jgi:hypothetical protein
MTPLVTAWIQFRHVTSLVEMTLTVNQSVPHFQRLLRVTLMKVVVPVVNANPYSHMMMEITAKMEGKAINSTVPLVEKSVRHILLPNLVEFNWVVSPTRTCACFLAPQPKIVHPPPE